MSRTKMRYDKAYQAYMQSAAWKTFRAGVLAARNNTCEACGAKTRLHVHHWTYARLGQERHEDVAVLCVVCHEGAHNVFDTAYRDIRSLVIGRLTKLRETRKREQQEQDRKQRQAMIKARVAAWLEADAAKDAPKVIPGARRRQRATEELVGSGCGS